MSWAVMPMRRAKENLDTGRPSLELAQFIVGEVWARAFALVPDQHDPVNRLEEQVFIEEMMSNFMYIKNRTNNELNQLRVLL